MNKHARKKAAPTSPNAPVAPKDGVPTIEVSDTTKGFFHRLVLGEAVGRWSGYTGIATLKVGDQVYQACTDYFHGVLPTNQVFVTRVIG